MTDFCEMKERVDRERTVKERERDWLLHKMLHYDYTGEKEKYLKAKLDYEKKREELAAIPPIEKKFGEL